MTTYLNLEDILARVVDTGGVVRDAGLLEAAVARPMASVFGEDAYPSLATKAAALLHSLAQNQALMDGNKRLAMASALAFLRLNDHRSAATQDELFDLNISMSTGLDDVTVIGSRLKVRPRPQ